MILLKVSGIETYYGKIQALKGVSLEVEQGKIVTILGANGAGKTTTMKSIAGLLKPKTGKIEFLGKDVTGLRPDQLLKQGMSLVPEGRAILSGMSVMENLEMGAYQRKDKDIEKDIENVMKQFPHFKRKKRSAWWNLVWRAAANACNRKGFTLTT